MMRRRACLGLLVPLLAAMAGCSDDDPIAPLEGCTGPVTLTATRGTTPTIRWTPACLVSSVLVEPMPVSMGFDWHWAVNAAPDLIRPGIRYGVLPPGTTQTHPAAPLSANQDYTVVLLGPTGQRIAEREFTP